MVIAGDVEPGRKEALGQRSGVADTKHLLRCSFVALPRRGVAVTHEVAKIVDVQVRDAGTASARARAVTLFPTAGPPVSRSGGATRSHPKPTGRPADGMVGCC